MSPEDIAENMKPYPEVPLDELELDDRVLYLGPPGIGKTERIIQLAAAEARSMNRVFVDLRNKDALAEMLLDIVAHPDKYYLFYRLPAPHIQPEDVNYPDKIRIRVGARIAKLIDRVSAELGADENLRDVVTFVKHVGPLEIALFTLPRIAGVLFIDEITRIMPHQEALYLSILKEKEVGFGMRLSPLVKVVAAGNPRGTDIDVSDIGKALGNRVTRIRVLPPSVDSWIKYMSARYGESWDSSTAAYLKRYPEDLFKMPPEDSDENFPSPRTWTMLAEKLYRYRFVKRSSERWIEAVVYGCLGPEVGSKFWAFLKLSEKLPMPEDVIRDPRKLSSMSLDAKFFMISSIANRWDMLLGPEGEGFVRYLAEKEKELLVLLYHIIPAKSPRYDPKKYGGFRGPKRAFLMKYMEYLMEAVGKSRKDMEKELDTVYMISEAVTIV